MKQYKNLIFDLDGTLIDSINDIVDAVNASFIEMDIQYSYSYAQGKDLIGYGARRFAKKAFEPFEHCKEYSYTKFEEIFFKNYVKYQGNSSIPFEGAVEFLKTLKSKGYNLFISTNKPQVMTDIIVKKLLPLDAFSIIIGQVEGSKEKPNPESVNTIIDNFKLKRNECIYVGDSIVDYMTAVNSNIDCIILTHGYGDYDDHIIKKASYTLNNFKELSSLFNV